MTFTKWYIKVIDATASYITRAATDAATPEEYEPSVIQNLLQLLGNFAWPSHLGAHLDIGARAEVIGQASELLALAETFLHPAAGVPL